MKKRHSVSARIIIILTVFIIVTLIICGFMTYITQTNAYKKQCENDIRKVGQYLETLIVQDGDDFELFLSNFEEHKDHLLIPIDFKDYEDAQKSFEASFAQAFPGKSFMTNVFPEDFPEEVMHKYLTYDFEYWTIVFEQAQETFNIPICYFMTMDETDRSISYIIDYTRVPMRDHVDYLEGDPRVIRRDISGFSDYELDNYIYLADSYYHIGDTTALEWKTYETGQKQDGYDEWDNEWGHTYAYYTPVIVHGKKMGLVGTEIDVATVNMGILRNTLQQIGLIAIVMIASILLVYIYINRTVTNRIVQLEADVKEYGESKDSGIVTKIEKHVTGNDEISALSEEFITLVMEIDSYISSLTSTSKELSYAREQAAAMNDLANLDALTGIRNRHAYDEEIKKLKWEMENEAFPYAIAMVDINFLKKINDTYGHEQGNVAIKKLAYTVCHVFCHSPVFRIGGDEFVVILRNEDLEFADELTDDFKDKLEEFKNDDTLEPWEKISAAIGVAFYDSSIDNGPESVLKRADKEMYRNKREMKAIRKD